MGLLPATALFHLITNHPTARVVRSAVELNIPEILQDGPLYINTLAAIIGADQAALSRLMRALCSIGVFMLQANEQYSLTPISEALLPHHKHTLKFLALRPLPDEEHSLWGDLTNSVRTGHPAFESSEKEGFFEHLSHNKTEAKHFHTGMTRSSLAQAPFILSAFEFSPYRFIVDLGGGQGALLGEILKACPKSRGVLMDLPDVISNPEPIIAANVLNRCEIVGGDIFKQIPPNGDLYLLKAILHDWSDDVCIRLLSHCRQALKDNADGRILIIEMVLPEKPSPHPGFMMDMNLLALTPGGRQRTRADFRLLLNKAGLTLIKVHRTDSPLRVLEARIRKRNRIPSSHKEALALSKYNTVLE